MVDKLEIGLYDGSFFNKSLSLGRENEDLEPTYIRWVRHQVRPVCVFTDMFLHVARNIDCKRKIAILLEPPTPGKDTHYHYVETYPEDFDHIFTFDKSLVDGGRFKWYPVGGSWLSAEKWLIHDKSKDVSLIASVKRRAPGHILRHQIAELSSLYEIDVMGTGYKPIKSKATGLAEYRYSIVTESNKLDDYFTEKLIDCMLTGTVPIYWGSPAIGDHFDMNGIITFDDLDQLADILINVISLDDYGGRIVALARNHETASRFVIAEDWLYQNWSHVFNE